jgi:hypothetical protein
MLEGDRLRNTIREGTGANPSSPDAELLQGRKRRGVEEDVSPGRSPSSQYRLRVARAAELVMGIATVAAIRPRMTIAWPSSSRPSQPVTGTPASSGRPDDSAYSVRRPRTPSAIASFWQTTRSTGRSRSAPIRNHSERASRAPVSVQRPSILCTERRSFAVSRKPRVRSTALTLVEAPVTRITNAPGWTRRSAWRTWIRPIPGWLGATPAMSWSGKSFCRPDVHSGMG